MSVWCHLLSVSFAKRSTGHLPPLISLASDSPRSSQACVLRAVITHTALTQQDLVCVRELAENVTSCVNVSFRTSTCAGL